MTDPHRPSYHFLPLANWINDPNGLIQWRGRYHLFYQHNPHAPEWGDIHWGHAVSDDLVHWEHLPIALTPTPGGPDQDGCWSGCVVDHDGVPTLLYTGVHPQATCLATSDDPDLRTWTKYPANPVIPGPPEGLDATGFRDPCVWKDGDSWQMVIGAGDRGKDGLVLLYRSADLIHWDYIGPILAGNQTLENEVWECPALFPSDNRWVLLITYPTIQRVDYFIGDYVEGRFIPTTQGRLDLGDVFLAPQVMRDDQGRRVMFAWVKESRDQDAINAAGWACMQTLPRILSLHPDGSLRCIPAPELETLRGQHWQIPALTLTPDTVIPLPDVQGDSLEIQVEIDPGSAQQVGIVVRRSPDDTEHDAEYTPILYDAAAGQITVERAVSSQDTGANRDPVGGAFDLPPGEPLRLRVFVDRSVIEVYANERACLTTRIYPSRPDSVGIGLIAHGGTAQAHRVDAWEMRSIW